MEKPLKKQVRLFYCVECEELARKVASHCESIQLQSINWRSMPRFTLSSYLAPCENLFSISVGRLNASAPR